MEAELTEISNSDVEKITKPLIDEKKTEMLKQKLKKQQKDKQQQGNSQLERTIPPIKLEKFSFEVITVDDRGEENSRTTKEAEFFSENLGNGAALEMVQIPSGQFLIGSPKDEGSNSEKPQHTVIVQSFWMGKYQVTQKQWRAVANLPKVNCNLRPYSSYFKGDNQPVEQVSWYDAVEFCARLSQYTGRQYRLPSEAEWEYACRAGTKTPFYFGSTLTPNLARCKPNFGIALLSIAGVGDKTVDVGQFFPNSFGLYDMHGNVEEWCKDNWHNSYNSAPEDKSIWLSVQSNIKVRRGGSWSSHPGACSSCYRSFNTRGSRSDEVGFRVVCVAPLNQLIS